MQRIGVIQHVPVSELEKRYRNEKDPRVKERLLTILHLYEGKTNQEAADAIKRSERSVRRWIRRWNERGYDGLVPRFTGGPEPWLSDSEWDKVLKEIEGKGMTIKDVKVYVKSTRGVEYGYKAVWKILRKEKKVSYGKPYVRNKRRPDNAEEVLKNGWTKRSQGSKTR